MQIILQNGNKRIMAHDLAIRAGDIITIVEDNPLTVHYQATQTIKTDSLFTVQFVSNNPQTKNKEINLNIIALYLVHYNGNLYVYLNFVQGNHPIISFQEKITTEFDSTKSMPDDSMINAGSTNSNYGSQSKAYSPSFHAPVPVPTATTPLLQKDPSSYDDLMTPMRKSKGCNII